MAPQASSKKISLVTGLLILIHTFALMGFTQYAGADDDSPYISVKRMTMETASAVALAAVLDCRKLRSTGNSHGCR